MRTIKIYCPVNEKNCPYYSKGECGLNNPIDDCDDFYAVLGNLFYMSDGAEKYIRDDEERQAYLD